MDPPVPIPNTEVKRSSADDTEGATLCGKYATARRLITLKNFCIVLLENRTCDPCLLYHLLYYNIRNREVLSKLKNIKVVPRRRNG